MRRADRLLEYLRTSLWVVPALAALLAVGLALGTIAIDRSTGARLGFEGGAEAARSVLSTIAAAMITFTGLVFSITIVALQLASGQLSPRVMRAFLRDRTSKIALGTFVATFAFAFTALRATRDDAVPGISVTIAILLVFASVGVFIHYINHTAHAIRASAVIETVAAEARESLERNYPAQQPAAASEPATASEPTLVHNRAGPGLVTGINAPRMVAIAAAADAVVVMRAGPGDFVPADAPLLELHGAAPEDCDVLDCISLGEERTMQQDAAFGFRQLVDLAIRALSPGVNDPTTAIQAIDQIHDLLRRLATRQMPAGRICDEDGTVRVAYPSVGWEDFVSLALDEVRIYGAGSLQVHRRLNELIGDVAAIAPAERRPPLRVQAELLTAAAQREFPDAHDREAAGRRDVQGVGS
ncbi:MAG: DUF2254 domain-containing protein [Thermoleophilaceae bacterium]|nr:DUF2254 domain-containing protein [Thermoleophilaceae bacterium]